MSERVTEAAKVLIREWDESNPFVGYSVEALRIVLEDEADATDEQTFRDFVEWTANLTDQQLANYDWFAHRANARSLLDVAEGGRLYAGELHGDGPCALCGRNPAAGFASIGDNWYCHGDYDPEPTCYMRATWALATAADPSVTKDGE